MILPQTQLQCLVVAILGLICLGGWFSAYKLTGRWRFELFYVDFAVGIALAAVVFAFTLGSRGFDGFIFMDNLSLASSRSIVFAAAAGAAVSLGNMLLLAAVSVAGMAVAVPVGSGLALLLGMGIPALLRRGQWPWILLAAVLILAALAALVLAYSILVKARRSQIPVDAKGRPTARIPLWKGVAVAAASSGPLAVYYLASPRARAFEFGLGPYAFMAVLGIASFCSTVVFSLFSMNLPIQGEPVELLEYFRGSWKKHLLGFSGGVVWCCGILALLVVSDQASPAVVRYPIYTVTLWGAPLVAAALGLLAWKEFEGSTSKGLALALFFFALFAGAIALVALAPSLAKS
jgi:glucose uptake protein